MDITFEQEIIDLGPLGPTAVYQVSGSEFQNACLQANSVDSDNTGYRLHGGAYVAIRAIAKLPFLFEGKRVLELGTGSGVVGIVASKLSPLASIALTDGNARALDIARMNAKSMNPEVSFDVFQLLWGALPDSFSYERNSFDIIIGSELMYYKTDVLLLSETVSALLCAGGVFVHTHYFRVDGLAAELATAMENIGLVTIEYTISDLLTKEDQSIHPEWLRADCLLSACPEVVDRLLAEHPSLCRFCPNSPSDAEEEEGDESDGDAPEIALSMEDLMSKYNVSL